MRIRIFIVGVALSGLCAVSVATQTPTQPPRPSAAQADLKAQVKTFEFALSAALDGAVKKVGEWAMASVPMFVNLTPAAPPVVRGHPLPSGDLYFQVEVSELMGYQFLGPVSMRPSGPPQPPLRDPALRAGTTGPPASATAMAGPGTVTPDPAGCGPSNNGKEQYAECVRQGLMEAMLKNSGLLPLKPGQGLHVVCSVVDVAVSNPVYGNTSRQLILSIKAEDLQLYRDKKVDFDQARMKIVENRF